MNPDLLVSWLDSESSSKRLHAARGLLKSARQDQILALRSKYHLEEVPWVKKALLRVITKLEERYAPDPVIEIVEDQHESQNIEAMLEEIKSEAVRDTLGQMLHELEPVIGALQVATRDEIERFEESKVKRDLERLDEVLDTFENWRRVERTSKRRKANVNIKDLISSIVCDENYNKKEIQTYGDVNLNISTDKGLLRIAIANGLRNALEASSQIQSETHRPIIIKWGKTDKTLWLTIIDHGIGLPFGSTPILKARQSTKPGHRGMGLWLAQKAVEGIGGVLDLRNGSGDGAEFLIEIPLVSIS